jgi:hypothetical protein
MKTFVKVCFIIVSAVLIFSCEDEPTPFQTPETAMYFNGVVNSYEKAIVEGENGYRYASGDSCAVLDNGMTWFASAFMYQGNSNYFMSNRESFGLYFHNLFDTVMTNRDSVIYAYFSSMPFAFSDSVSGPDQYYYGAEVIWVDGKGDVYTSLNTPQSNNVTFDLFSMSIGANGRVMKIEASFACSLYSRDAEKTISLTDGKARVVFNTTCY